MQALLSMLTQEKYAIGPCGVKEIKLVVATLWFVSDYAVTWILS